MFCPAIYCFVLLTGSLVYGNTTLSTIEPNTSLLSSVSSWTASTSPTPSASVVTSQYSVSTYSDSTAVSPTKPSIATSTNSSSANATTNTTAMPMDSSTVDVNSSSTVNGTSSKPTSLPLTSITLPPDSKPMASSTPNSTTAAVGPGMTSTKAERTRSTQIPALSSTARMSNTVLPQTTSGKAEIDVTEPTALSAASVVAIVLVVIVIVIVVFGGAYYLKMRSSYGRLLEDTEYSTVGNFQNPLYEH
ncbi:prostate androgen-regulated mucin-like protein 1 isoform X2 [Brienomyrus brachyistius]|uniref:prostate androgen-regulated mucin-like protein 1 isoform X2 n=1 Tax=Brienomyrus brachyistius TaxID=42636 RepID=UPI0020B4593D|nr:prostate androgen-regulated mucin-like protein 1 isoform X2 [Brienomyrus brachyistius]